MCLILVCFPDDVLVPVGCGDDVPVPVGYGDDVPVCCCDDVGCCGDVDCGDVGCGDVGCGDVCCGDFPVIVFGFSSAVMD
ncbi:hypothetical protein Tco_0568450 [Tanacetum coccineum]